MKSTSEFQSIVKIAVEAGHKLHLATTFEVATSTVDRWISGIARPHPRLQQMIIDECRKILNK